MNIVTTTSVFPPCYPPKLALSRLKACGFRHLDLAFDYLVQEADFPFVTDAWEAWAHELADFAKKRPIILQIRIIRISPTNTTPTPITTTIQSGVFLAGSTANAKFLTISTYFAPPKMQ
mgnify:CR=1 FL=1